MARGFAYFVMNDKKLLEFTQLSGRVNYWQTFKWAGEYDQVKVEVDASDFSAKNPLFQLALAAIKDDFESVFRLLPSVLENGHLKTYELLDWPLFQAVREKPEFATYLPHSERQDDRRPAEREEGISSQTACAVGPSTVKDDLANRSE